MMNNLSSILKCKVVSSTDINTPGQLYILSDEEFKIGDWLYNIERYIVYQLGEFPGARTDYNKKIIATTDPLLELPIISDEFIKDYCELGKIDEVDVEYIKYCKGYFHSKDSLHNCSVNYDSEGKLFYQCCGNIYREWNMRDLKLEWFSFLKVITDSTFYLLH